MAKKIKVNIAGAAFTGKIVTFKAPCDCTESTGLVIGEDTYDVVDALGNCITGSYLAWRSGALVSVALDVEDKTATLQSSLVTGGSGGSGVEIGPDEPASGDVWIDTDDEYDPTEPIGSGVTVYTATIGTTWTEDSDTGVKSQNVAIEGVTAENTATVDHVFTDGTAYADFVEAENQYLTYITNGYAETYDGGVTFHIFGDAPTVAIPIVVEVV